MDTIFDGKPEPKLTYSNFITECQGDIGPVSKSTQLLVSEETNRGVTLMKEMTFQELIEKEKRFQEEEKKRKLEERQYINSFLRNMIKWVKFDGDWTVVKWFDGKITKVKKQPGEVYSKEVGLLWCIAKKMFYQNPNILFEVMREFVGEEQHEPTAAFEDFYDKDIMRGYLNRLTHWALDITDALEKAEGNEEHASDMYQLFTEIRNDMRDEYGVDWI